MNWVLSWVWVTSGAIKEDSKVRCNFVYSNDMFFSANISYKLITLYWQLLKPRRIFEVAEFPKFMLMLGRFHVRIVVFPLLDYSMIYGTFYTSILFVFLCRVHQSFFVAENVKGQWQWRDYMFLVKWNRTLKMRVISLLLI